MTLPRVLPDTNVCFPISLLDLLLRLDEVSLHEIIWTEDLLGELADTWVSRGIRTREAAERVCDHIRAAFVRQDVPRAEYEHLVAAMPGDDPGDHLHAALRWRGRRRPSLRRTCATSRPSRWPRSVSWSVVPTTASTSCSTATQTRSRTSSPRDGR